MTRGGQEPNTSGWSFFKKDFKKFFLPMAVGKKGRREADVVSVVDEIVDEFADEILWPVVKKVSDIVRDVFRLAFHVDDKEEAFECFQQKRAQQLRAQQGRFRHVDNSPPPPLPCCPNKTSSVAASGVVELLLLPCSLLLVAFVLEPLLELLLELELVFILLAYLADLIVRLL